MLTLKVNFTFLLTRINEIYIFDIQTVDLTIKAKFFARRNKIWAVHKYYVVTVGGEGARG